MTKTKRVAPPPIIIHGENDRDGMYHICYEEAGTLTRLCNALPLESNLEAGDLPTCDLCQDLHLEDCVSQQGRLVWSFELEEDKDENKGTMQCRMPG